MQIRLEETWGKFRNAVCHWLGGGSSQLPRERKQCLSLESKNVREGRRKEKPDGEAWAGWGTES